MCIASSTKSKELQMHYGAREERIIIAFLTVDVDYFRIEREEYHSHKLLYVGSIIERKGIDLLFQIYSKLEEYELVMIGGNLSDEYIKLKEYME